MVSVGIIGKADSKTDLQASLEQLTYRGPDRQDELRIRNAHLGHTRLSIIDTSDGGDQPMLDPTGRYALVFNGEIYNYRTIAQELRLKGVQLTSNSDTEVLLHLLIHEGEDALTRLNGFFAFAFYDSLEDRTILARDRVGIKPLYYHHDQGILYFASELKALNRIISQSEVDPTALHFYFQLNYIPAPLTLNKEVKQMLPGEGLIMKAQESNLFRFYEVNYSRKTRRPGELRSLMEDAVRLRMISDVPLGSFLSGGVDSSIVAALACKEDKHLKTFSIGFKDNAHFDESSYAEMVADHIGSEHTTIQLLEDDMLTHVEKVLDHLEEPFADSSAIAVYALSEHTRKHVTVALSGDGADELFGGYNKHQAHLLAESPDLKAKLAATLAPVLKGVSGSHGSKLGNMIRKAQRFESGKALPYIARYWSWASWTDEATVGELLQLQRDDERYMQIKNDYGPADRSMEEILRSDTRLVLANDMLCKVDRMSMANSLEVRVPFLDHRIVEYAHSIPAEARFKRGKGKYILQSEFSDLLPAEIFDRKKKGFEVPLETWFNGPLHERLLNVFEDDILKATGWFDLSYFNALHESVIRKNIGSQVHLLWALMVLDNYLRKHLH